MKKLLIGLGLFLTFGTTVVSADAVDCYVKCTKQCAGETDCSKKCNKKCVTGKIEIKIPTDTKGYHDCMDNGGYHEDCWKNNSSSLDT